jgi:hypothetical protein
MATYTRAQLRNQVMEELGLIEAGETPEASDANLVNARCQQKLEELDERGLIPFDLDSDAIPARYMAALVKQIAPLVVGPFGLQGRREDIELQARQGMAELNRLRQADYVSAPTPATYF